MLYRTCTHLHRTSGTSRGSARHCPGPQHRRHKRVRTAGGCPTLAALSPQLQAGHTLLTPVFLGAGTQSLRRAVAPHPLSGRPRVLKVIPSSETALSVEWATPVLSSGFQAPMFSVVCLQDPGVSFLPYQSLVWVFPACPVLPSLPQPHRWPVHTLPLTFGHILFSVSCLSNSRISGLLRLLLRVSAKKFHKDMIASAGGWWWMGKCLAINCRKTLIDVCVNFHSINTPTRAHSELPIQQDTLMLGSHLVHTMTRVALRA